MNFLEQTLVALRERGDQPWILHGDRAFTGRGLLRRAGSAQAALGDIRPGERVVLLGPNSPEWIAIDLAIQCAGALPVPFYTRQSPDEMIAMIEDCRPALVICADEALAAPLRESGAPVRLFAELDGAEAEPEVRERGCDDPVRIFYTSGTSGAAKGAVLTVGNVDFMLPRTCERLDLLMAGTEGRERVFHYLPFCFAGSWILLHTCLRRGALLRLATSLETLVSEMGAHEPHFVLNVPLLLERMRAGIEEKTPRWLRPLLKGMVRRKLFGSRLKALICGSAPLAAETQRFFGKLGVEVLQVYGLTETTAICTMDVPGHPRPGCVGLAIEGCEMALDEQGAIRVRGPHVFAGYWGKEPFAGGWLDTGDLGEMDATGNWRIHGRAKNLIVLASGHNVAPEPLEEELAQALPGAEQVVVSGDGKPGLVVLVAGSVARAALDAALERVNAGRPHYARVRAAHLHPGSLADVPELLTANGKLRRDRIAAHFEADLEKLYAS